MVILVFLVNMCLSKVFHHFKELYDLFIIFEHLPVLYIVWYGGYVPHLYVILNLKVVGGENVEAALANESYCRFSVRGM
jgi:hypothetical protein